MLRAYYPKVVGSNPTPATNENERHSFQSCAFYYLMREDNLTEYENQSDEAKADR